MKILEVSLTEKLKEYYENHEKKDCNLELSNHTLRNLSIPKNFFTKFNLTDKVIFGLVKKNIAENFFNIFYDSYTIEINYNLGYEKVIDTLINNGIYELLNLPCNQQHEYFCSDYAFKEFKNMASQEEFLEFIEEIYKVTVFDFPYAISIDYFFSQSNNILAFKVFSKNHDSFLNQAIDTFKKNLYDTYPYFKSL